MDFIITERTDRRQPAPTDLPAPGPARPATRLARGGGRAATSRAGPGPGQGPGPTTRIIDRDCGRPGSAAMAALLPLIAIRRVIAGRAGPGRAGTDAASAHRRRR